MKVLILFAFVAFVAFVALSSNEVVGYAASEERPKTSLATTAARVASPGLFDVGVEQQPVENDAFVTTGDGKVSQFRSASAYGTIGILGHNDRSGAAFAELRDGDEIAVTFSNGQVARYRVDRIEKYQALSPTSPLSDFVSLDNGEKLTASQLFMRVYGSGNALVLQTCIENEGNWSWGRMFVVAKLEE